MEARLPSFAEATEDRAACVYSDGIVEIVRKMLGFLLDIWGLRGRMSGWKAGKGSEQQSRRAGIEQSNIEY